MPPPDLSTGTARSCSQRLTVGEYMNWREMANPAMAETPSMTGNLTSQLFTQLDNSKMKNV